MSDPLSAAEQSLGGKAVRSYRVVTDGTGKHKAGLFLGYVSRQRDGWRFLPGFQRAPSRKGWATPEEALKGRVKHYALEPQSPHAGWDDNG